MSDIYNIDDHVDEEIIKALDLDNPQSFFLFAGAGSGKTRTLVNVLRSIKNNFGRRLRLQRKQVAVITYTNNACDEIKERLGDHSLFYVSTIHSYAWEIIRHYPIDIKEWMRESLHNSIIELEEKERKGRAGAASDTRKRKIESKKNKLLNLDNIKKFTYNPNGDNLEIHSLNHSEVINVLADFLVSKPLLRSIMINAFPILLIDESQDTFGSLVDALVVVQQENKNSFALGLIGDTMQRIYPNGKVGLDQNLPVDWLTPQKRMNHRSGKHIVNLINKIRSEVDGQIQLPRNDRGDGFVKLFLISTDDNGVDAEKEVATMMKEITKNDLWQLENDGYKTLIIEHKMAARRNQFINLFEPLYAVDSLKTGLLDGTLSHLRVLNQQILPFLLAKKSGDEFLVSQVIKKYSPLLDKEYLLKSENQIQKISEANIAAQELYNLWKDAEPDIITVLRKVEELNIFTLSDTLKIIIAEDFEDDSKALNALRVSFNAPFSEVERYENYISGASKFETHQGVKGLEYPRVMVVLSDEEAGGFLFSYDKLLGAKSITTNDIKNKTTGKETSVDRTKRLFYVACSRAQESLAIAMYTNEKVKVRNMVVENEWFKDTDVIDVTLS